ncbi:MAG: PilZ domain-containing protein [Deltaproteobacteria bacterium]|nr:PilZ domain-containing protein [Deltaproteobacteria bacterium]
MANGFEKRRTPRIPHRAIIRYCSGNDDEYRPGRMINHNATGMYLELNYPPPKLGEELQIEVLETPPDSSHSPEDETGAVTARYFAKVIWKKNLPISSQAEYGVGLNCLVPPQDD